MTVCFNFNLRIPYPFHHIPVSHFNRKTNTHTHQNPLPLQLKSTYYSPLIVIVFRGVIIGADTETVRSMHTLPDAIVFLALLFVNMISSEIQQEHLIDYSIYHLYLTLRICFSILFVTIIRQIIILLFPSIAV